MVHVPGTPVRVLWLFGTHVIQQNVSWLSHYVWFTGVMQQRDTWLCCYISLGLYRSSALNPAPAETRCFFLKSSKNPAPDKFWPDFGFQPNLQNVFIIHMEYFIPKHFHGTRQTLPLFGLFTLHTAVL